MGQYFVVLFDTFAYIGAVNARDLDRVEATVRDKPVVDDEHHRGWTHGSEELLQKQFTWLDPADFAKCREIPHLQHKIYFE